MERLIGRFLTPEIVEADIYRSVTAGGGSYFIPYIEHSGS